MLLAIYHWIRILGQENVLLVQTEFLHLSNENLKTRKEGKDPKIVVQEQLDKIHKFLKIVPFAHVLHTELHKTGIN